MKQQHKNKLRINARTRAIFRLIRMPNRMLKRDIRFRTRPCRVCTHFRVVCYDWVPKPQTHTHTTTQPNYHNRKHSPPLKVCCVLAPAAICVAIKSPNIPYIFVGRVSLCTTCTHIIIKCQAITGDCSIRNTHINTHTRTHTSQTSFVSSSRRANDTSELRTNRDRTAAAKKE